MLALAWKRRNPHGNSYQAQVQRDNKGLTLKGKALPLEFIKKKGNLVAEKLVFFFWLFMVMKCTWLIIPPTRF